MPTFYDPVADAEEASQALRGLAHASRDFTHPEDAYGVIGDLLAGVRSMQQSIQQLATRHARHDGRAFDDAGDPAAGIRDARLAAGELSEAAAAPDLWDDPDAAQVVTSNLSHAQADLKRVEDLGSRIDDLEAMVEMAGEESGEDADELIAEAENDLGTISKDLSDLEIRTLLSGEYDPRDPLLDPVWGQLAEAQVQTGVAGQRDLGRAGGAALLVGQHQREHREHAALGAVVARQLRLAGRKPGDVIAELALQESVDIGSTSLQQSRVRIEPDERQVFVHEA